MTTHADPLDQTSDFEQRQRDQGLALVRLKANMPKIYHTHCGWCGEPTTGGD